MGVKFANNFETTISGSINSSVTTIAITSATGFPSLGAGDYAYCTLENLSGLTQEIVKVTAISGTSLTVVRAQEGTSASAFAAGDAFELRITATGLTEINNYSHPANHAISVITGLQSALDGKIDDSQVLTNVPSGAVFTDTTYSVQDGQLSQNNFTNADHSKLDGIAASATNTAAPHYTSAIAVGAGGLTQQNFTTTLKNKLDGIAASATNTAAPHYTSAIAVGAGGLTQQNFTTALKNKLDGIAASATANTGDITAVTAGSGMSGGGASGAVTLTNAGVTSIVAGSNVAISGATGAVTITGAYSVGAGGLTQQNFTTTLKNKLDGIANSANYITNNNQLTNGAGYVTTNTTYSVGNGGLTEINFTSALNSKLSGIAASANNYTFPYSFASTATANAVVRYDQHGYLNASYISITPNTATTGITKILVETSSDGYIRHGSAAGVRSFLNVADGATNTAAPHYTSAIAVGAGGLTQQNFTTTLKNKLDGIAASANNYTFPYTVSSGTAGNTVVQRHSSGYIFANYFNTTPNTVTSGVTQVCVETGHDGYIRHGTAAAIRTFMNVADGATNTAAPHYTSAIAVGAGGLTQQNFTTTLKNKLDGVATNANYITNNNQLTNGAGYSTGGGAYSDWAIKTSNYTAATKDQLICNSSTEFTVSLPGSPSAGHTVIIVSAGTGGVVIGRNGANINSAAENGTLPKGNSVQLVYVDSTIGWFEV